MNRQLFLKDINFDELVSFMDCRYIILFQIYIHVFGVVLTYCLRTPN